MNSQAALCLFAFACATAQPDGEKLLLGFEEPEIKTWSAAVNGVRTAAKTKDGVPHVVFRTAPTGSPSAQEWKLFKGKATEGDQAMALHLIGSEAFPFEVPDAPKRWHALYRSSGMHSHALNTCGTFRRILPMDWSAHDRLRLDVHCEEFAQTIRVQLEDEEIQPPIDRSFVVKPGKWTTLEIDLGEAVKVRRLDLKRMATLTAAVVKVDGKTPKYPCALLDNVRLSSDKAPAALPVLRDESTLELPAYYKASGAPVAERLPARQPDRTPLVDQKPIVIPLDKPLAVTPVGWAAAYDNQHLLVGFCDASNPFVLQSSDGGLTWQGLDGGARPTQVPMRIAQYCIDHQAGRGDVVGKRSDIFIFSNMGCYGTVLSPPRYFSSKLTFTGKGWELVKEPALVDCDPRHCTSNQSVVRTADGRLWAAYGLVGRLGANHINVRYSDDDGLTWKASREGTSGVIPDSIVSDRFGVGFGYSFDEPVLVPFGEGVACIWDEYPPKKERNRMRWTHFDGAKWSPVKDIPAPPRTGSVWCRPHLHAVSLGGKEIFVASGFRKGIMRYNGRTWAQAPIEAPFGARLSVAGDKTVVVIGIKSAGKGDLEKPDNTALRRGPMVLVAWQRGSDGKWTGPRELVREEHPLTAMSALNELRPGLQVQAYAPPNFVPIAWSCEKQKWLKYLRIPVD
jgi:hypothetical protein